MLPVRFATSRPDKAGTASRPTYRQWYQHLPRRIKFSWTSFVGAHATHTCLQPLQFQALVPEILRRLLVLRKKGLRYLEKSMSEEPSHIERCTRTLSTTHPADDLCNRSPSQMRTILSRCPQFDKDTRSMNPLRRRHPRI